MVSNYDTPVVPELTLNERVNNLSERLDKQLEREEKILARLKRLEDRVDRVWGADPSQAESENVIRYGR